MPSRVLHTMDSDQRGFGPDRWRSRWSGSKVPDIRLWCVWVQTCGRVSHLRASQTWILRFGLKVKARLLPSGAALCFHHPPLFPHLESWWGHFEAGLFVTLAARSCVAVCLQLLKRALIQPDWLGRVSVERSTLMSWPINDAKISGGTLTR